MRHFLFFCSTLWFASCSSKCPECDAGYSAIRSFSKKLLKENDWSLVTIGGSFNNKIHELNLKYSVNQKVDVTLARNMIVHTMIKFKNYLNQNSNIQLYLDEIPFEEKKIEMGLLFQNEFGKFFPLEESLAFVSTISEKIIYTSYDKTQDKLIKIHEETFEEALKILNEEEPKFSAFSKNNQN
jgi:hypothetical protein